MPRRMPRFDRALFHEAQSALGIVKAGEMAHLSGGSIQREWSLSRLEALHELAYLRVFAAWETCLESVFYRSLCGYASTAGQEMLVSGRYYPNLAAAEAAVLGGNAYALWHSPQKVIDRCSRFIAPGSPRCQETVIASNLTTLINLACIRHRIVHDQSDAKNKFDAVTTTMATRTYPASRPGKFLRDRDTSTSPPKRWLDVTTAELISLAQQIV